MLTEKLPIFFRRVHRYFFAPNSVVITGLGRCGTSLLANTFRRVGFLPGDFLIRIDEKALLKTGYIYKSHSYPPNHLRDNVKLIFMFGNPMNIALSTYNMINISGAMHHLHLQSDLYEPNESVLYKDTLQLYSLFTSWYRKQNFNFISVRYETLYADATQRALKEYFGFNLPLPPYKKRKTNWKNHPKSESLFEVYGKLNELIEEADDFRIWEKKSSVGSSHPLTG